MKIRKNQEVIIYRMILSAKRWRAISAVQTIICC